ncbi:hypothetical protein EC912_101380 [Luteibacter rhizovicinus]|uniref:Uncharacterized protein n=2 Tax=Luteibacter rhizovicinus TaxID=242606 RepID=A0A4R3YXD0_9GAMM|nr:hypothetical protein EC912_101380 [Luteibacter rhizovicinus]
MVLNRQRLKNVVLLLAGSVAALLVHFLIYDFRYIWYASVNDGWRLIYVFAGFVVVYLLEIIFVPARWLLFVSAFLVLILPSIFQSHPQVPLDALFLFIGAVSSGVLACLGYLRIKWCT